MLLKNLLKLQYIHQNTHTYAQLHIHSFFTKYLIIWDMFQHTHFGSGHSMHEIFLHHQCTRHKFRFWFCHLLSELSVYSIYLCFAYTHESKISLNYITLTPVVLEFLIYSYRLATLKLSHWLLLQECKQKHQMK